MLPFEDARPVRAPAAFKGQRNFTGLWWCATTNRHVGFESWCERDHLMCLDFDPKVVGGFLATRSDHDAGITPPTHARSMLTASSMDLAFPTWSPA